MNLLLQRYIPINCVQIARWCFSCKHVANFQAVRETLMSALITRNWRDISESLSILSKISFDDDNALLEARSMLEFQVQIYLEVYASIFFNR